MITAPFFLGLIFHTIFGLWKLDLANKNLHQLAKLANPFFVLAPAQHGTAILAMSDVFYLQVGHIVRPLNDISPYLLRNLSLTC